MYTDGQLMLIDILHAGSKIMSNPVLVLPSVKSSMNFIKEGLVSLYMFSLLAKIISIKTISLSCLLVFAFLSSLNAKMLSFMCCFSSLEIQIKLSNILSNVLTVFPLKYLKIVKYIPTIHQLIFQQISI